MSYTHHGPIRKDKPSCLNCYLYLSSHCLTIPEFNYRKTHFHFRFLLLDGKEPLNFNPQVLRVYLAWSINTIQLNTYAYSNQDM